MKTPGVTGRRRRRSTWCLLAALGMLLTGPVFGRFAGRELTEVLDEMRDRGLPLIWSTATVPPGLLVVSEPQAKRPLRALRRMLEEHGLTLTERASGRLLVVPNQTEERPVLVTIRGTVVDRDGEAVAHVVASLRPHEMTIRGDDQGRFELSGVPVGPIVLELHRDGRLLATDDRTLEAERETVELVFEVDPDPVSLEEIDVVGRMSLFENQPASGLALDRDAIQAIPHFADDVLRAVKVLPGVSAGDLTAAFQVRGGLADEVMYRLDGLELYDPFHLRDLNGVFSIFDPKLMAGVELITGNFPAEYGDRSGGVLDMRTTVPDDTDLNTGISFSSVWLSGGDHLDRGDGRWLASARRGYLDVLLELTEEDVNAARPRYWDAFGKIDRQIGERNHLAVHALTSEDEIHLEFREPRERTDARTTFVDRYLWLRHLGLPRSGVTSDSVISIAQVDHDRFAEFRETNLAGELDEALDIVDDREVDLLGLRQDWGFELRSDRRVRHWLKIGLEGRIFNVTFNYADRVFREYPIDDPRFEGRLDVTEHRASFEGEHWSAYLADRIGVGRLVAEVGLRYDRQTLLDSNQVSPRLNLLWASKRWGTMRAAWGHFHQSQKPHELDVQFGETAFQPVQRDEHWSLGWQRNFAGLGLLRVEAYRRRVTDPRRRYEILFDPFRPVPQRASDLIVVEPERAEGRGVEIHVQGRPGRALTWFASLALAETEDVLADGTRQPRFFDQRRRFAASLTWRPNARWTLAGVLRHHSGWPTTALRATAEFGTGERVFDYEIGPFYGERLPDFVSLDLRFSRRTVLRRGTLDVFLDVLNVLGRDNIRGVVIDDFALVNCAGTSCDVRFEPARWAGRLPSFGVSWAF